MLFPIIVNKTMYTKIIGSIIILDVRKFLNTLTVYLFYNYVFFYNLQAVKMEEFLRGNCRKDLFYNPKKIAYLLLLLREREDLSLEMNTLSL